MSAVLARFLLFSNVRSSLQPLFNHTTLTRSYAKKIVSKVSAQAAQKSKPEVESDPVKLMKYCCGTNIYSEGNDPEIKPDFEYPEWLWNLRIERGGQDLSELDPNTAPYWKRLARITYARNKRIKKRLASLREIQFPEDKM